MQSIEISRPVDKRELVPMLAAFVQMCRALPHASLVCPPLGTLMMSQKSPIDIQDRYKLARIADDQIAFDPRVTDFARVIRGQLAGHEDTVLAFKMRDITYNWKGRCIPEEMDHEARVYQMLEPLQGDCVPKFVGYVDWHGIFHALVLEDCGRALTAEELKRDDIQEQIRAHLQRIHALGVLHDDLALRNVTVGADGRVRIIDFNHARILSDLPANKCQRYCQKELDRIVRMD